MIRILLALVIGAIVAAGIMLGLAFLIGGDWVSEAPEGATFADPGDQSSTPVPVRSGALKECYLVFSEASQLIDDSRECVVDSDCALLRLQSDLGFIVAVNSSVVPGLKIKMQSAEIRRCSTHTSFLSTNVAPLGWRAACELNRCQVRETTAAELERTTRETVTN